MNVSKAIHLNKLETKNKLKIANLEVMVFLLAVSAFLQIFLSACILPELVN
jgi:hypothetical protein